MRIGILTKHRSGNWGSALQSWATWKLWSNAFKDSSVELIDCMSMQAFRYANRKRCGKTSKTSRKFDFNRKLELCHDFLKRRCQWSTRSLISDDLRLTKQFIEQGDYDVISVGSDTVFQLGPNVTGAYISAAAAPNLFFLPFQTCAKKVAFAASCNPYRGPQELSGKMLTVRQALDDFAAISVRDQATLDMLRDCGLNADQIHYLPDPALLVDLNPLLHRHPWRSPLPTADALISVGKGSLAKSITVQLQQRGLQTINLLSGQTREHRLKLGKTIHRLEDVLQLHRQARWVITDRFHSAIMKISLSGNQLIGIEISEHYPNKNSKLRDVFNRLGIADQLMTTDTHASDDEAAAAIALQLNMLCNRPGNALHAELSTLRRHGEQTIKQLSQAIHVHH